jgi:metal-responsive CopG/Arc/MetJ family transcriptional regulator
MARVRTTTVHVRLPESDVKELDKIAADEQVTTRSEMIARIVRTWLRARSGNKRIHSVTITLSDGTEQRLTS